METQTVFENLGNEGGQGLGGAGDVQAILLCRAKLRQGLQTTTLLQCSRSIFCAITPK
jgi:hypothetical protein